MATPPQAATEFYADQQARKVATLVLVDRLWSQIDPHGNWSQQFDRIKLLMGAVIGEAQEQVARRAQRYADDLMRELRIEAPAEGQINPAGFGGWNGDGRTVEQALGAVVAHAGQRYSEAKATIPPAEFDIQAELREALAAGRRRAALIVSTSLADTARAAASTSMAARPALTGYIRMLTPPSCSRCIVLAGRFYKWNEGFERHPQCDCLHIPEAVANQSGALANPGDFFDSLSEAEQDKAFGKAGAQAIRDGASISQVVNARSGVRIAQDFGGQKVKVTTTGTTKRAYFGGGYAARKHGDTDWFDQFGYVKAGGRYRNTAALRLMPETIYQLASDRDEAVRLLKRYGFIL